MDEGIFWERNSLEKVVWRQENTIGSVLYFRIFNINFASKMLRKVFARERDSWVKYLKLWYFCTIIHCPRILKKIINFKELTKTIWAFIEFSNYFSASINFPNVWESANTSRIYIYNFSFSTYPLRWVTLRIFSPFGMWLMCWIFQTFS